MRCTRWIHPECTLHILHTCAEYYAYIQRTWNDFLLLVSRSCVCLRPPSEIAFHMMLTHFMIIEQIFWMGMWPRRAPPRDDRARLCWHVWAHANERLCRIVWQRTECEQVCNRIETGMWIWICMCGLSFGGDDFVVVVVVIGIVAVGSVGIAWTWETMYEHCAWE